jgi:hypothetical protein
VPTQIPSLPTRTTNAKIGPGIPRCEKCGLSLQKTRDRIVIGFRMTSKWQCGLVFRTMESLPVIGEWCPMNRSILTARKIKSRGFQSSEVRMVVL